MEPSTEGPWLLPPVLNGFLVHSFTFTKTKRQLLLISRAEEARRSASRGGTGTGLQSGPTTHGLTALPHCLQDAASAAHRAHRGRPDGAPSF